MFYTRIFINNLLNDVAVNEPAVNWVFDLHSMYKHSFCDIYQLIVEWYLSNDYVRYLTFSNCTTFAYLCNHKNRLFCMIVSIISVVKIVVFGFFL